MDEEQWSSISDIIQIYYRCRRYKQKSLTEVALHKQFDWCQLGPHGWRSAKRGQRISGHKTQQAQINNRIWTWKWSVFYPWLQAVAATSWWRWQTMPTTCVTKVFARQMSRCRRSQWLNFGIETCLLCNHPGSKRITWTKELNLCRRIQTHPFDMSRNGKVQRHFVMNFNMDLFTKRFHVYHHSRVHISLSKSGLKVKVRGLTDAWNGSAGVTWGPLIISARRWVKACVVLKCLTGFPFLRYMRSFEVALR